MASARIYRHTNTLYLRLVMRAQTYKRTDRRTQSALSPSHHRRPVGGRTWILLGVLSYKAAPWSINKVGDRPLKIVGPELEYKLNLNLLLQNVLYRGPHWFNPLLSLFQLISTILLKNVVSKHFLASFPLPSLKRKLLMDKTKSSFPATKATAGARCSSWDEDAEKWFGPVFPRQSLF